MNKMILFSVVALMALAAGLVLQTPAKECMTFQPSLANKVGGKKNSMPYKMRLKSQNMPEQEPKPMA